VASPADRLAMLLERGPTSSSFATTTSAAARWRCSPAFVRRIDRLKAELIDAERYAAWAAQQRGRSRARVRGRVGGARPDARASSACFDDGGVLAPRVRLLRATAPPQRRSRSAHPQILVDDWQESLAGERELVAALELGGSALSARGRR
jgi:hypothetical protein